jgi:hypothetical protein
MKKWQVGKNERDSVARPTQKGSSVASITRLSVTAARITRVSNTGSIWRPGQYAASKSQYPQHAVPAIRSQEAVVTAVRSIEIGNTRSTAASSTGSMQQKKRQYRSSTVSWRTMSRVTQGRSSRCGSRNRIGGRFEVNEVDAVFSSRHRGKHGGIFFACALPEACLAQAMAARAHGPWFSDARNAHSAGLRTGVRLAVRVPGHFAAHAASIPAYDRRSQVRPATALRPIRRRSCAPSR